MQLLDPSPYVNRVSVEEEDDSGEPVLEIPPNLPDFTSDDVWDAFSDFSGDISDFRLEEFDGGAFPDDVSHPVVSDDESANSRDGSPLIDDSADIAGSAPNVTNSLDPAVAWRLANMSDDALLALLFTELLDLEPQGDHPQ